MAGLAAFVITWSIGQPLSLSTVAFPFWIALGIAAAWSQGAAAPAASRIPPAVAVTALAGFALVLAVTLPVRAARASSSIVWSRVTYGFIDSGRTDEGGRLWWVGPRATFFQPATVEAVDVPMAASLPTTPSGVRITVRVNGVLQAPVTLPPEIEWHSVRIRRVTGSAQTSQPWRVDLEIEPIGVPSNTPDEERRIAVGTMSATPARE